MNTQEDAPGALAYIPQVSAVWLQFHAEEFTLTPKSGQRIRFVGGDTSFIQLYPVHPDWVRPGAVTVI
jgi:hypothetical protein